MFEAVTAFVTRIFFPMRMKLFSLCFHTLFADICYDKCYREPMCFTSIKTPPMTDTGVKDSGVELVGLSESVLRIEVPSDLRYSLYGL